MIPSGLLRRLAPRILVLLSTLLAPAALAQGQPLPRGATPRGVVVAFMTETCSAAPDVDRALFRERLAGELAGADPESFRGTVPNGAKVRIDSIPDLPVDDPDTRRAVAWVTVSRSGEAENSYIYLRRDSIWHIEAVRRLVPSSQRAQIRSAAAALDTSIAAFRLRRADLEHLLLSDDSLSALLRRNLGAAERVVAELERAPRWGRFALRDVDFSTVDEYRELDDDVPLTDLIFYQIDRTALDRLRRDLGIRRIDRDRRFPKLIFLQGAVIEQSHYGYVHSPAAAALPPLSQGEFIVLRPVADGWWLYKRLER